VSTTRSRSTPRQLLHKNPITAYDHRVLSGQVRRTWLHGTSMYNVTEGGAGEAPRFRGKPRGRPAVGAGDRRGVMRPAPRAKPGCSWMGRMPPDMAILQPGRGEIPGEPLPAPHARDRAVGRLPCEADAAALQHRGGLSP
jgi:hypothetical protein